jgi:hypothetical protein
MKFEKYIQKKNLEFHNVLWNDVNCKRLASQHFDMLLNNKSKQINSLFFGSNFSKQIKQLIALTIGIEDDNILKIYWEELKVVRNELRTLFNDWSTNYIDYIKTRKKDIFHALKQRNIIFDESDSIESIFFDFLTHHKSSSDDIYKCKICYENNIECILLCENSSNKSCVLCNDCAQKLRNKDCPFCRVPFSSIKEFSFH